MPSSIFTSGAAGTANTGLANAYQFQPGSLNTTIEVGASTNPNIPPTSRNFGSLYINNTGTGQIWRCIGSGQWVELEPLNAYSFFSPINLQLTAANSAGALTFTLAGTVSTYPVIPYTQGVTGTTTTRSAVYQRQFANTSLTVPSGATLGTPGSSVPFCLYLYAVELATNNNTMAVSRSLFPNSGSTSTTLISAAASSATTVYSINNYAGIKLTLIARLRTAQATAGTWASGSTELIHVAPDYYYFEQFAAKATVASNQTPLANAAINFGTINFDSHGAMVSGVYTAYRAGRYLISSSWQCTAAVAATVSVYKNGAAYTAIGTTNTTNVTGGSAIVDCAIGDTLHIGSDSGTPEYNTSSSFSVTSVGVL